MNQPFYTFTILEEAHRFDFVSVGKRPINKMVAFQQIGQTRYYNLILADLDDGEEPDVFAVSDNGDMRKILATVFQCINEFLKFRPEITIIFTGSTKERTEIYHWLISRELEKAARDFQIYGYKNGNF